MKEKPLRNGSVIEKERRLWQASRQYLSGDINVESFEKEELPQLQNFRQANPFLADQGQNRKLISYTLIFICVLLILLGFTIYLANRNQLSLILPAVSVYLINIIIKDFLSEKNREIH